MGTFRFVLAFAVVFAHLQFYSPAYPVFLDADIAVEAFFIVSGFLITLVLSEKYPPGTRGSLLFYSNRALRIFPTYWAALALFVIANLWAFTLPVIGGALTPDVVRAGAGLAVAEDQAALLFLRDHGDSLSGWMAVLLLFANLFLFGQDLILFISGDPFGAVTFFPPLSNYYFHHFIMLKVAWTLALELMFYVIAPAVVRRLWLVLLLMAGSLALRLIAFRHGYSGDAYAYKAFPLELAYFLAGSLAYRAYAWLRRGDGARFRRARTIYAVAAAVLLTALTLRFNVLPDPGLGIPERWWLYISRHAYLAAAAVLLPGVVWLSRRSRWDNALGSMSYPVYLTHTLFAIIILQGPSTLGIPTPLLVLALTVLLSVAIVLAVERPLDRQRQQRVIRVLQPAVESV